MYPPSRLSTALALAVLSLAGCRDATPPSPALADAPRPTAEVQAKAVPAPGRATASAAPLALTAEERGAVTAAQAAHTDRAALDQASRGFVPVGVAAPAPEAR